MNGDAIEKEEIGSKSDLLRYEVVKQHLQFELNILKFQIVYQYGGIYCDTDCIR